MQGKLNISAKHILGEGGEVKCSVCNCLHLTDTCAVLISSFPPYEIYPFCDECFVWLVDVLTVISMRLMPGNLFRGDSTDEG